MSDNTLSKALSMYKWIKECRPYHLTLDDVKTWKMGDAHDVAMFDSNFEENDIWANIKPNTMLPATAFFKHNRTKLVYKGDMKWDIHFDFGETVTHPLHLCTSGLATSWHWNAIDKKDGQIHITSEMHDNRLPFPSHKSATHLHWTAFPDATRVGWRGPMIDWKHLEKLPPVYWKKIA